MIPAEPPQGSGDDSPKLSEEKAQKARDEINAKINELLSIGQQYDPLGVLSRVCLHLLFSFDPEHRDKGSEQGEAVAEFLLSLYAAQPYPNTPEPPSPPVIQRCLDLIEDTLQQASVYHTLFSRGKGLDRNEEQVSIELRLHTLHVRGDAYFEHTVTDFLALCAPHDGFLKEHFGFTSAELLDTSLHAEKTILNAVNVERGANFDEYDRLESESRTIPASDTAKREDMARRASAWWEQFNQLGGPQLFRLQSRHAADESVFRQLSLEFGGNAAFLTGMPKWRGWPLNPSRVSLRPLLRHGDNYYAFHPQLFARSASQVVENLINEADETYWREKFLPQRDAYVEREALALLARALPGCRNHATLFYEVIEEGNPKWVEADGLVEYGDALFIVEAKAGSLHRSAQRGAIPRFRKDAEECIDYAYHQALRTERYIQDRKVAIFYDEDRKERVRVRGHNYRHFFLVCVVREQFVPLPVQLPLLRQLGFLAGGRWPWIVSLSDLRVITEVVQRPTLLPFYLLRRLQANEHAKLQVIDELDLFMHFLDQGLYFKGDKNFEQSTHYALSGFTEKLDQYYRQRYAGGRDVQPPRMKLPAELERLLTALETARPPFFVSAALAILQYDSKGREQMAEAIPGLESRFLEARVVRLLALNSHDADASGIILACAPAGTPQETPALHRAYQLAAKHNIKNGVLILWDPPLERHRFTIVIF